MDTLCCITLGGFAVGVVTFLVTVGVACAVDQDYVVTCTLGSGAVGDGGSLSLFVDKS